MTNTNAIFCIEKQFCLVTLYCFFDDVIRFLELETKTTGRNPNLSLSELASIWLIGVRYGCRDLKSLWLYLIDNHKSDFRLPSYKCFVESMNRVSRSLMVLLFHLLQANQKELTDKEAVFVDSTPLPVCKIYRASYHSTMKQISSFKKTTTGWFYGLKLHAACDASGNLLALRFTTASVDDRAVLQDFFSYLENCILVADAGYVGKEYQKMAANYNSIFLACSRKNMSTLAAKWQNLLMNLRSCTVETVFSVLKERLGLVSSLPRSVSGYLAHYFRVIFGYVMKGLVR
jgi:hypothetical protein